MAARPQSTTPWWNSRPCDHLRTYDDKFLRTRLLMSVRGGMHHEKFVKVRTAFYIFIDTCMLCTEIGTVVECKVLQKLLGINYV